MRKVLLLITLSVIAVVAQSQTNPFPTANASSSSFPTTGGPAAIASGTTAGLRLGIAGNQMLYGTGSTVVGSPTLYFRNTTATTGKIWAFNSGDLGLFTISDATGTSFPLTLTTRFSINSSGNVGIGTTTQTSLLEVNGSFKAGGIAYPTANGTNGQVLTTNGAGVASWQTIPAGANTWGYGGSTVGAIKNFGTIDNFDLPFITNNTEKMRLTSAGNLGIGTTTPAAKLDVNGNANFLNNITVLNSNTSPATFQTWKRAAGGAEIAKLESIGDAGVFTLGYNWLGTSRIALDGGSFSGPSTLQMYNGTTQNISLSSGGNSYLNGGNLGLGISTPTERLTLPGNNKILFTSVSAQNRPVSIGTDQFDNLRIDLGMDLGKYVYLGTAAGFTSSYTNLNNNVGIGVSAPAERLEVAGNVKANGLILPTGAAAGKVLTSVDGTGTASWQPIPLGSSGWNYGGNTVGAIKTLGTVDNFALPFITNSIERARFTPSGNLLLGTTTEAGYKLDMDGGVSVRNSVGKALTTNMHHALVNIGPEVGYLNDASQTNTTSDALFVGFPTPLTSDLNTKRYFRVNMEGNDPLHAVGSNNDLLVEGAAVVNSIFRLRSQTTYTDIIQSSSNFSILGRSGAGLMKFGQEGAGYGEVRLQSQVGPLSFYMNSNEAGRISPNSNLLLGTTTDLGYKAQVNGTLWTKGFVLATPDAGAGKVLTSDANGIASWQTVTGGSGSSQWTTSGADIFNANTGNIAIGTSTINPAYKLDVAGAVHSNYGFFANGNANSGFYIGNSNEAYFHYGPNQTRISGGYAEYIDFGGPNGNQINMHANETIIQGASYHMGGINANFIRPITFSPTATNTFLNPDIGIKVSSTYVNNGAGGPNYAATLAIGDANINTAAGVTNDISALLLNPTVNTSGGTTKVRGLLYNPTLTSVAGVTNVAIETVTGNTILGSTSGNTLIGTNTANGSKLQVLGSTHITLPTNNDGLTIKSTGVQNFRKFADFNITDADGTSNSYGLSLTAYNADAQNRILKVNQYNATAVAFAGGNYTFENPTTFVSGIDNQWHTDFNITLKSNTQNPSPTGIKFYAQDYGGGAIMSIMQTGKVGVGTTAPTAKFHTAGTVRFEGLTANNTLTNVLVTDASGNLSFRDASTLGSGTGGSSVWATSGTNIVNANAGLVVIGTMPAALPNDATLKLAVNGSVYAQKLKVTANGWADYVFDSSYKLRPLAEVEKFVKTNQHLPEIPTATDVANNGVDVGENQTLLLKKVEELTLYMIELNKKIDQQQALINAQQKKIEALSVKDAKK